jgi:hypothetical protein
MKLQTTLQEAIPDGIQHRFGLSLTSAVTLRLLHSSPGSESGPCFVGELGLDKSCETIEPVAQIRDAAREPYACAVG